MNADSQKIAAAQSGGGAGGGQTNIVAPQSSVVNAPQSQTINAPLNATPTFGRYQSFYDAGLAGQRPVF